MDSATGDPLRRWPLPAADYLLVGASADGSLAFLQRTSSDQNRSSCVAAVETRTGDQRWSVCGTGLVGLSLASEVV